jgi:hypothetical protein
MIFKNESHSHPFIFLVEVFFQAIVYSLVIAFSLALNQIFIDIKHNYIPNKHQLWSQIGFTVGILIILLAFIILGIVISKIKNKK